MNLTTRIIRADDGFAILRGVTFATVGNMQWFTSPEQLLLAWQHDPGELDLRLTMRALFPGHVGADPTHNADFLVQQFQVDVAYNTSPLERALNAETLAEVVAEVLRSWRALPSTVTAIGIEQIAAKWGEAAASNRAHVEHGALMMLLTMTDAERHQLRVDLHGKPAPSPPPVPSMYAADIALARTLIVLAPEYQPKTWETWKADNWEPAPIQGDQIGAVRDFIAQIQGGPRTEFLDIATMEFGTKRYDQWARQRCDCNFGYGPRHGRVNMSVALRPEWRGRVQDLPADLVAAVVRVLDAMLDGRLPTDTLKEAR